ncbi:hypothetical protein ACFQ5N_03690 [Lutibacter holmesii]|uniref:Uncharacterized protein n=1 Tax=Lutibacter holmesii TaxID=1137985 RepID=A0ABW3WKU9_9FLAO
MKLTKEQITYIDDYLKHHKVKYWDIRIELLDHIVTNVEALMEKGISFDKALEEVHISFGNSLKRFWNSGIAYGVMENGIGYEKLIDSKRKEIHKKYNRLLFKEIKNFFTTTKTILLSIVVFAMLYFTFIVFKNNILKIIAITSIVSYSMSIYYFPIKLWFQNKREKSINLQNALNYMLLAVLFLNCLSLFRPKDASSFFTQEQYLWFVVSMIMLYFITNYCGAQVYKKAYNHYSNLYDKLQQL